MIDISDGLASEVLHLSDQSGVGFRLYEEKIPMDSLTISTADEFNLNPVVTALSGGKIMNYYSRFHRMILIKLKITRILRSSGMPLKKKMEILWSQEDQTNWLL